MEAPITDLPRRPNPEHRPAGAMLRVACSQDRAGRMDGAVSSYEDAIRLAVESGEQAVRVEALRRLGVVHHRRNSPEQARELCRQSHQEALDLGDPGLAGEALNALGGFAVEAGDLAVARHLYHDALGFATHHAGLEGRIEQNLGILANIQGDHTGALRHYRRSLEGFERDGDERGSAIAYHNLGMIATQRGELDEAERCFGRSAVIAARAGDVYLEGLCELHRAEVSHARAHFPKAMRQAEAALAIFEQIGARMDKSAAYKVVGMVFRDTGRLALGEERLLSAISLALQTDWILGEAEASRELAFLYRGSGRNQEALTRLNQAHSLFRRLDARVDLVDVATKMSHLEGAFLSVVKEWGQSIESADRYTFGHCERVAEYAQAVAQALGLDAMQQTTLRLGAYLHDVGKVRVPHEILNKPGRLTADEFEVMKLHPVYGLEMLTGVEFPWDLKSIIRWHHEKLDGSGYPDRLRGDEIPLGAQVIGIVDVYDALTTTRSYREPMPRDAALAELDRCRHWWRADVFRAFMDSVGAPSRLERSAAA